MSLPTDCKEKRHAPHLHARIFRPQTPHDEDFIPWWFRTCTRLNPVNKAAYAAHLRMMDDLQEMFMTKGKAKVVVEVRKTRKRLEVVRQNRNC
jgi:hypothetical protein